MTRGGGTSSNCIFGKRDSKAWKTICNSRRARFIPRQKCGPPPNVWIGLRSRVIRKRSGFLESFRVVIGGGQQSDIGHVHVGGPPHQRRACDGEHLRQRDGAVKSQHFLDRRPHRPLQVGQEQRQLIGVREQSDQAVADHVRGGLVAAEIEDGQKLNELRFREHAARILHQRTHQIVARLGAPRRDHLPHILALLMCSFCGRQPQVERRGRIDALHEHAGELRHVGPILGRQTYQLRHDVRRKDLTELRRDVHRLRGVHPATATRRFRPRSCRGSWPRTAAGNSAEPGSGCACDRVHRSTRAAAHCPRPSGSSSADCSGVSGTERLGLLTGPMRVVFQELRIAHHSWPTPCSR